MKIYAGLGFDGRPPSQMAPRLNELVAGPERLLQVLEFRAGLVSPIQSHAERVVRYRNALEASAGPDRFYRRSLQADPLATAEELLSWRDFALDHGWSGCPGSASPGRLGDLAEVEARTDGVSPCLAERIAALTPRVHLIAAAVSEIVLADDLADWPPPWRRLFPRLSAAGVDVRVAAVHPLPGAPAESDIGRLQRALLDASSSAGPLHLAGDGSLRLYQCLEAHGCASALCDDLARREEHLLVAGGDAFVLGSAARGRGLPNPGLGERSQWRPSQQLLRLMMQVAWSPPAADVLLQYLTLPAGPLSGLRRDIARLFTDQPGHDRESWQVRIDAFVQRRLETDSTLDGDKLRQRIDAWLPIGAAGNRAGMPIELAIDLCDRVRDYWRTRFGQSQTENPTDSKELLAAFQTADAMSAALRDWYDPVIPREQLHRLLDIATISNASGLTQARQVGALNCVEAPEAARMSDRPPAHLAWWDPALGHSEIVPPFDRDELAALPDAPDSGQRQAQTQSRLTRALWPLVTATESALLVAKGVSGDLLRLHLDRLLPADAWRSFEEELLAGRAQGVELEPVNDLGLPAPRRWWQVQRALPCPRERESYSGLASLALSPHEYVLRYGARLAQGSIVDIPVDARLKGNLGHRLIQCWFDAHPWTGAAPGSAEVAAWLDATLDAVVATCALPLAAPGRRAERLVFRDTFANALINLLGHLDDAGALEVRVESRLERSLPDMELEGTVDLLARLPDNGRGAGRWAIVDVKWGSEGERIAELKEGRYLQLATYVQLVKAIATGPVGDFAYFILRTGELLSTSNQAFPNARLVAPDDPSVTPAVVWQRLKETVDWRCAQLADGWIEVTGGIAESTADSQPLPGTLPLLEMEEGRIEQARGSGGRKPSFKPVDPWRVITGNIHP